MLTLSDKDKGLEFRVYFNHTRRQQTIATGPNGEPGPISLNSVTGGGTLCTIEVGVMGEDPKERKVLVMGEAQCSVEDRFVKENGRRVALARALGSSFDDPTGELHGPAYFSKAERQAFWDAYFMTQDTGFGTFHAIEDSQYGFDEDAYKLHLDAQEDAELEKEFSGGLTFTQAPSAMDATTAAV